MLLRSQKASSAGINDLLQKSTVLGRKRCNGFALYVRWFEGEKSVGVARQSNGRLAKVDNRQVSVTK